MMVTLIGLVATTAYYQNQNDMWTTQLLQVEFDDEQSSALVPYIVVVVTSLMKIKIVTRRFKNDAGIYTKEITPMFAKCPTKTFS